MNPRRSIRAPLAVAVLSASLLAAPALQAQQTAADETTVTYPASYFAQYAPVSAKDMIDRIPGVGSTTGGGPPTGGGGFRGGGGGGGGRGFGSGSGGSEILINGKRTAGKNNQTSAVLDRITADQVDYIELIRGTGGELDVRGSGQVVNVVLFEELDASSFAWEINSDYHRDGNVQPGANASYTNRIGNLDMVLSAVAEPRYNHQEAVETSVLGDFSPNDFITEDRITDQTTYELSANLAYEFSASSSARFNALYSQSDNPTDVFRTITDFTQDPSVLTIEREDIPGERDNWEIGGDYELLLPNNSRFKVLFVINEANEDITRERYELITPDTEEKNLFLRNRSVTEEEIVRGSYTFNVTDNQDLEMGVERAITTLDSKLDLGVLDEDGTPSDSVGGLVPQNVNNAYSVVQETRYEPFLFYNWSINPRTTLETSLLYEYSEIEQWGDVNKKRDFDFVKPKVDLRYDLTPSLQLRGIIEKRVLQLRFSDFVAATDNEDEDSNTFAGNADLTQEWLWDYNVNVEYRLPNDAGVIDGNIFYHEHMDRIARIDVSTSEDNLQSANGNIGDGTVLGARLNASLRMGMINLPNLLVTSNLSVVDSEVVDPFLGIERRFSQMGRGRWTLSFRHDIPQWSVNWGASWSNRFDGNQYTYDIDDYFTTLGEPTTNLFAEYITNGGISFRFDARDATSNEQCRERRRFVGRLSAGILEEIEDRCWTRGIVTSLKISGSF
jgi:hypothetical protein